MGLYGIVLGETGTNGVDLGGVGSYGVDPGEIGSYDCKAAGADDGSYTSAGLSVVLEHTSHTLLPMSL